MTTRPRAAPCRSSKRPASRTATSVSSRATPTIGIPATTAGRTAKDGKIDRDRDGTDDRAEGAAAGAGIGATVGGAAGLLAGLGLLAIPGLGPVVAAGWLVSTAAVAAAGGATGGIIGALSQSGIGEDDAHVYAEGVRRGGTLVTARIPDARSGAVRNDPQPLGRERARSRRRLPQGRLEGIRSVGKGRTRRTRCARSARSIARPRKLALDYRGPPWRGPRWLPVPCAPSTAKAEHEPFPCRNSGPHEGWPTASPLIHRREGLMNPSRTRHARRASDRRGRPGLSARRS